MILGAFIAAITVGLQAWFGLIKAADWHQHKWLWILTVIVPFVVVLAIDAAYRIITAPWRVYQDQEREFANAEAEQDRRFSEVKRELAEARSEIERLIWLPGRPQVHIREWSQIPADHAAAIYSPQMPGMKQHGFVLQNDGGPALEVHVEDFSIQSKLTAKSDTVSRLGAEGGFTLVWMEGTFGGIGIESKWDLLYKLRRISDELYSEQSYRPDGPTVQLSITYRDSRGQRYRTLQEMKYIPAQNRIAFGAPKYEAI